MYGDEGKTGAESGEDEGKMLRWVNYGLNNDKTWGSYGKSIDFGPWYTHVFPVQHKETSAGFNL